MQTPAPGPTPAGRADDETELLDTKVIRQAATPRPTTARPAPFAPRPTAFAPGPTPPAGWPTTPGSTPPAGWPTPGATPPADDEADKDDEKPSFTLNTTQVVASMAAAVVAAFIGAQLGVAGTIAGAAIASVISVVGSAVIGHSLLVTRSKVVQTVQHVRTAGSSTVSPADSDETVVLTAVTRQDLERTALMRQSTPAPTRPDVPRSASTAAAPSHRSWWRRPGRIRWALLGLATSVLVFAGALGMVTMVEAVKGAPISGGSQGGFSVLGGNGRSDGGAGDSTPSTTPSTTVTATSGATTGSSTVPTTSSPVQANPGATAQSATSGSTTRTTSPSTTAPSTTASSPAPATAGAATSGASGR